LEITNYIAIGLARNGKFSAISNEVVDEILSRREGRILGYYTPVNVNLDEIRKVAKTLPPDIENLYYSDFHYSPFKITKRSFALLKYLYKNPDDLNEQKYREISFDRNNVENLLFKYTNVLKSTIGILYSIRSELDAMKLMLERNNGVPIARLNNRLDSLKTNLSNVLELGHEELEMFIGIFKDCIDVKDKMKKIKILEDLIKASKFITNFWTIRYFNIENINPPPYPLVPRQLKYDKNLIRKPEDNPLNPLKVAKEKASGKKGGFIGSLAKSLFTRIANYYRRNYCNGKARPLYPGEYHYGCHNFTGPGTRIDLQSVRDYQPYNDIDNCSRQHDLDYYHALQQPDAERKRLIREADHGVLRCYDKYPNENGYTVAKLGINGKMGLEKVIPIVARSVFGKISAAGYDSD
jgi:hypothetical protein